ELSRDRWDVETAFHALTVHLKCELNTLGYPKAALFGFCMAVACYNVWAAARGALRAAHGAAADEELSAYYVADELRGVYRGMAIAVPAADWALFAAGGALGLARRLEQIAGAAQVSRYRKHTRGPKGPKKK